MVAVPDNPSPLSSSHAGVLGQAGVPRLGRSTQPCLDVNPTDGVLPLLGVRSRTFAAFRTKEWEHFLLTTPELLVTVAVVDAKYMKLSWCSVVDRRHNQHREHSRRVVLGDVQVARSLRPGHTWFHAPGYQVDFQADLDHGGHTLQMDVAAQGTAPALHAEVHLAFDPARDQPLVVTLPVAPGRAMYSHKFPMPASGRVVVGDRAFTLDPRSAVGVADVHKGQYPYRTHWHWATCAGRDARGRLVGVNLTRNINDNDRELNENVVWVDGQAHLLDRAVFEMDARRSLEPWHLRTQDGAVDLTFSPQGERTENVNAMVLKSVYHQPWGVFRGTLRVGGDTLLVEDFPGVTEVKDSRW